MHDKKRKEKEKKRERKKREEMSIRFLPRKTLKVEIFGVGCVWEVGLGGGRGGGRGRGA